MLGSKTTLITTILLVSLVSVQAFFWMLLIAVNPILFLSTATIAVAGLTYVLGKREANQLRSLLKPQSTRKPFTQALKEYLELLEN